MTANQNPNTIASRIDVPFTLNEDESSSSANSTTFVGSTGPVNLSPEEEFTNYDGRSFVEKIVGKRVKNDEVSGISIKSYVFDVND